MNNREKMVKQLAVTILFDLLVAGCLASVLIPRAEKTKNCNEDLFYAGFAICAYILFFVVRNLIICASCYASKNPSGYSTVARWTFLCVDCFLYTAVVVWATDKLFLDESTDCKNSDEEIDQFWWAVLILIVVGYFQLFIQWIICLFSSCIMCFFCCFYFAQQRQHRADALARFR